jgi:predicted transcriptional regulator
MKVPMANQFKSYDAKGIGGVLRNPLVVFGLILLAGDGPLVTAYALTSAPSQSYVLMWATILFIFGMGAFFCYLVAFKPRHLYAPDEIPEIAIEKNLYKEPASGKNVLKEAQELVDTLTKSKNENQRKSIAQNINTRLEIANEVQTAYELLLIPGYDVSIILDILDSVSLRKRVDSENLAKPRNITPSTIDIIVDSMNNRDLLDKKHGEFFLTENGRRLMNSLHEYFNEPGAKDS